MYRFIVLYSFNLMTKSIHKVIIRNEVYSQDIKLCALTMETKLFHGNILE